MAAAWRDRTRGAGPGDPAGALRAEPPQPPVTQEPFWHSSQTRQLAAQARFDCHSDQAVWPWYTSVAPFPWLAQSDVDRGRARLNFSEWNRQYHAAGEARRQVQSGEMPPSIYLLMHPGAHLTAARQQALIQGLQATLGSQNASPLARTARRSGSTALTPPPMPPRRAAGVAAEP